METSQNPDTSRFTLFVDDNFHFMEDEESYIAGVFNNENEAVTKAKAIVDGFLRDQLKPGIRADDLYSLYCSFGECPWISPGSDFSAWAYAKIRCVELCSAKLD